MAGFEAVDAIGALRWALARLIDARNVCYGGVTLEEIEQCERLLAGADIEDALKISETLLVNMKAMVEQAAPEIQIAMQQLRDRLEAVTAERDTALAKLAELE